jgi:TRAP-type C4-dicarboxylate transport system substrate-binding protein
VSSFERSAERQGKPCPYHFLITDTDTVFSKQFLTTEVQHEEEMFFFGWVAGLALLIVFLGGIGTVKAQKKEFRYADEIYNNRRADYYGWHRAMDLIEERSKGQITFKRLTKGIAGLIAQTTEAVQRGTLDLTVTFATTLTMHSKAAGAFILPFLFNLPEDMIWNIPSPEARELMDVVEKEAGMKILTVGIYEERSFFNNKRPIKRLEDAKGLRIRTMESPDEQYWVGLIGARPGASSFAELYNMLKAGVFDDYDGNFSVHDSMKYYEVNKYLSIMG